MRSPRLKVVSASSFPEVLDRDTPLVVKMIDVQIKDESKPEVLAELIEATLHGHIPTNPTSSAIEVGRLVREQQAQAEANRPSRHEVQTVSFSTIDPDEDWSDV